MKKLKVPCLPTLDVLDFSSVDLVMEAKAQWEYIESVNWEEEFPYKPVAAFGIARTDRNLYIRYFVRGNSLKASYAEDGSPVYTDSCVEFFMKKEEDAEYMNFEFNCIGTCDASRRLSRSESKSVTAGEYLSIRRYPSVRSRAFPEKTGIHAWALIVCIPFEVMGLNPDSLPEKIMGNFYKCADGTKYPHYLSWNPVETKQPDFHRPEYFGEIFFS